LQLPKKLAICNAGGHEELQIAGDRFQIAGKNAGQSCTRNMQQVVKVC
jgi:hypothetical protein